MEREIERKRNNVREIEAEVYIQLLDQDFGLSSLSAVLLTSLTPTPHNTSYTGS